MKILKDLKMIESDWDKGEDAGYPAWAEAESLRLWRETASAIKLVVWLLCLLSLVGVAFWN